MTPEKQSTAPATTVPATEGGRKLKGKIERALTWRPHSDLQKVAAVLPPDAWDRLSLILDEPDGEAH